MVHCCFAQGCTSRLSSLMSLRCPSPPGRIPLLPGRPTRLLPGQTVLELPVKTGLLLPLCPHGTMPGHLLTPFRLCMIVIHVCYLGDGIALLKYRTYAHIAFYFGQCPTKDPCPWYTLSAVCVGRMGSGWTTVHFWEASGREEVKLHQTFFFKLYFT